MKNSNKKRYTAQEEAETYSDSRIFDVEENLYNNPYDNEILTFDQKTMQKNKSYNVAKKCKKERNNENF